MKPNRLLGSKSPSCFCDPANRTSGSATSRRPSRPPAPSGFRVSPPATPAVTDSLGGISRGDACSPTPRRAAPPSLPRRSTPEEQAGRRRRRLLPLLLSGTSAAAFRPLINDRLLPLPFIASQLSPCVPQQRQLRSNPFSLQDYNLWTWCICLSNIVYHFAARTESIYWETFESLVLKRGIESFYVCYLVVHCTGNMWLISICFVSPLDSRWFRQGTLCLRNFPCSSQQQGPGQRERLSPSSSCTEAVSSALWWQVFFFFLLRVYFCQCKTCVWGRRSYQFWCCVGSLFLW